MNRLPLPSGPSEAATDIFKVLGVTGLANSIALADVEKIISIVSLLIATGYVVWKWHRDIKRSKSHEKAKPVVDGAGDSPSM